MPIKKDREYRMFAVPLVVQQRSGDPTESRLADEDDFMVAGYAATFEPYVIGSCDGVDYTERIDPAAFEGADMSDVILVYNHQGMVFARVKNGTLKLSVDDIGLKVEADLSRTEAARQMYEGIKARLVDQMSFAFTVREDSYDHETHTRTILKFGKIYDVSPVSLPANPDTDISAVSARDYLHGAMEMEKAERLEREKRLALAKEIFNYHSV